MFLQNVAKVIEEPPETEAGADNLHYVSRDGGSCLQAVSGWQT